MTGDAIRELERVVIFAQSRSGLVPEWAPRPLLPHELRAGVNFAAIDRIQQTAYAAAERALRDYRSVLISDLGRVTSGASSAALTGRIAEWVTAPRPRAVLDARADAVAGVHLALVACSAAAGRQVHAEATSQGVRVPVKAAELPRPEPGAVDPDTLADEALIPVVSLETSLEQAALTSGQRPPNPDIPMNAVEKVSVAAATDLVRQAVHIAHGAGRSAAAHTLPAPVAVYASELLDMRTCSPCHLIDGRTFSTLADAEREYPGSGPYRHCLGGPRCRGTLVLIWPEA